MGLLGGVSMLDISELLKLKEQMDKLAVGIDPTTDVAFSQDTILNDVNLKRAFENTAKLLEFILCSGGEFIKKDSRKKYEFSITEEQKANIVISNKPIPISTFAYMINDVVDTRYMKKLRATQITTWLMTNGYLEEIEHEDGKIFKVVTDKAKTIGITADPKENSYGRKYEINMYDECAQKFILDNLDYILK